jgi:hypothetical protein
MRRSAFLRALTLALALLHTLPARKHLAALLTAHSASQGFTEGWKGIGATVAIGLYLLPVDVQTRGLRYLWSKRAWELRVAGALLAIAHAVPALDHVPRLIASPNFADAWRGIGATIAVAWFAAPVRAQARVLGALVRFVRPSAPAAHQVTAARPI